MEQNTKKGIAFAVLAAALYAINAPFSKLLLEFVLPTLMAGFLYIDTFGHCCSNLSIIGVERYNCGQCFPA